MTSFYVSARMLSKCQECLYQITDTNTRWLTKIATVDQALLIWQIETEDIVLCLNVVGMPQIVTTEQGKWYHSSVICEYVYEWY